MKLYPILFLFVLLVSFSTSARVLECAGVFTSELTSVQASYSLGWLRYYDNKLSEVTDASFPSQHAGIEFARLSAQGLLLNQKDRRLAQRNLLPSKGGLCGSTCMTNVAASMLSHSGALNAQTASTKTPEMVEYLVKTYTQATGKDGRRDVYMNQMGEHFDSLIRTMSQDTQRPLYGTSTFIRRPSDLLGDSTISFRSANSNCSFSFFY